MFKHTIMENERHERILRIHTYTELECFCARDVLQWTLPKTKTVQIVQSIVYTANSMGKKTQQEKIWFPKHKLFHWPKIELDIFKYTRKFGSESRLVIYYKSCINSTHWQSWRTNDSFININVGSSFRSNTH